MSAPTSDYLEAIEHLPEGATLVLRQFSWSDYERLLGELQDRPNLRVTYDRGKLEIMSPLPEHEEYARFVDDLTRAVADNMGLRLQKYGSATWRRQRLARGTEADSCYYVTNAQQVIGKRRFDLEVDPPPDIVVEIDITNESLTKFPIYAALAVPEIWRYDGETVRFYKLDSDSFLESSESLAFPGLTPDMLRAALQQSKTDGQSAALAFFRRRFRPE